MIRATITATALILTADNEARADLAHAFRQGGYPAAESTVAEELHEAFRFILPETVGALTDAPILAPFDAWGLEDDGRETLEPGAPVFWFPDYMIRDPWRELANRGRVVLTRED